MQLLRSLILFALSCIAALGACKTVGAGARDQFGKTYSCPDDRVTSRERPDVAPADVLDPSRGRERPPPPEVAADPARLAKWESDRADERASRRHAWDDYEIWEVSGCEHTQLLACHHPIGRRGGAQINDVACQVVTVPAPRTPTPPTPPTSAPASSPATACASDADCVLVTTSVCCPCCPYPPRAVNVRARLEEGKSCGPIPCRPCAPATDCPNGVPPPPDARPPSAKCVQNACTVVVAP